MTALENRRGVVRRKSGGFALLEVAVGLAILGITAVAFLGGIASADRATTVASAHVSAESLARKQMEALKASGYIDYSIAGHPTYSAVAAPTGYLIALTAVPVNPVSLQPLPAGQDQGMQTTTVVVSRNGQAVFTLSDLKVRR